MTNKELGTAIRKELKAAGFSTKDISVRVKDASYDTSVRIEIKNPLVRLSEVEEIAGNYKSKLIMMKGQWKFCQAQILM